MNNSDSANVTASAFAGETGAHGNMALLGGGGPGRIILFGSGETGKYGRRIQEIELGRHGRPVKIAILETPAGFQPNVDHVTTKLKTFYEHNLQNLRPVVTTVPARKRGSACDPDDPEVSALVDDADVIVAGPGSPTYTVRQLTGSRALDSIRRRHALGATLVFASAAAIAIGALAIPVYEIFKVGDDPFWSPGLDLLSGLGIHGVIVPHWNNAEGGADLDTSHCFVGAERFAELQAMLPPQLTVFGLDEHTAMIIDPESGTISVQGAGRLTIHFQSGSRIVPSGESIGIINVSAKT